MDSQGEYEGQNFTFTAPDSMDNGGSQNLTKLTTANMEDMEEYYNFGKDTSSYTTPWVATDQKTFFLFLFLKAEGNYRIVVETLGDSGKRGFHLVLASFQKRQTWRTMMGGQGGGGVLQRRRFNSVAYNRDTETVDTVWSSSFGITTLTGSDSHWWTVKSVCCVYVSVIWRGKKRKKLQLQSHWLHLMW